MAAKFELTKNAKGTYHFHLKAANGEIILTSQVYKTKEGADQGIASVKKNATKDTNFERRTAKNGSPFFDLKSPNHEIIGSSEMYKSVASMENGVASVAKNAPAARIVDLSEAPKKATKPAAKRPAKK